jgi:hypothetical protein
MLTAVILIASLNMFVAAFLIDRCGWEMLSKVYAVALVVTTEPFWIFSAREPARSGASAPSMMRELLNYQTEARCAPVMDESSAADKTTSAS